MVLDIASVPQAYQSQDLQAALMGPELERCRNQWWMEREMQQMSSLRPPSPPPIVLMRQG